MDKKTEKVYLLYDNKEQSNLLELTYNSSEINERSQYYAEGVWYMCDIDDKGHFVNERLYNRKVDFPKAPKQREIYIESKESYSWIK